MYIDGETIRIGRAGLLSQRNMCVEVYIYAYVDDADDLDGDDLNFIFLYLSQIRAVAKLIWNVKYVTFNEQVLTPIHLILRAIKTAETIYI